MRSPGKLLDPGAIVEGNRRSSFRRLLIACSHIKADFVVAVSGAFGGAESLRVLLQYEPCAGRFSVLAAADFRILRC